MSSGTSKKKQSSSSELLFLFSRLENLERAEQTLVDTHHGTRIVELPAVVRCTKQGNELAFGEELVSVLDHLMGTADEVHVMFLQEAGNHVRAKGEADTSVVFAPASDVFVGVRPQEITQKTTVRDVSWSHDTADLLHRVQVRAETAVHGEDLLVNDGCDGQAVEAVRKCLPQLDVVSALALIVETVDAVDGGALVVATQDEEVLWILDLVRQEKADGLERLLATVDVVTKEQVVCLWGETAVFEQTQEVIVLTVDVAADLNRSLELEQDGLRDEDLADGCRGPPGAGRL